MSKKHDPDYVPVWLYWLSAVLTVFSICMWILVLSACVRPSVGEPRAVDTPWCFRGQYREDIGGFCFVNEERCNWWRDYVLSQPIRDSKVGACRRDP